MFFFFNDTATTEIYTLSLHDALPILSVGRSASTCATMLASASPPSQGPNSVTASAPTAPQNKRDRKSTRLNSSHDQISYAVFCLKKKKSNIRGQGFGSTSRAGSRTH